MWEIYNLENDVVKVTINSLGAEVSSLILKEDNTEYIWQANPKYWGRHAPILFPIVGRLKENIYRFENKAYTLTQHGFARDLPFQLTAQTKDSCSFKLTSSAETLAKYPFQFELLVSYHLAKTSLKVNYEVKNTGNEKMYFAIGGHPGFNWPLVPALEKAEDYIIEFTCPETVEILMIEKGGLLSKERKPFLQNEASFPLSRDLFASDALIFEKLKSSEVTLKSKKTNKFVRLAMPGFPYLGIWSPIEPAPFICLEPWYGIADQVDTDQDFTTKLGNQNLKVGKNFSCSYTITIG